MADLIINLIESLELKEDEELVFNDELEESEPMDSEDILNNTPTSSQEKRNDPDYNELSEKSDQHFKSQVSFKDKIRIVALRDEHPKWSHASLKAVGGKLVPRLDEINRWRKYITKGGTKKDKLDAIINHTFNRFKEARENKTPVTTRDLQVWAIQVAQQFYGEEFKFVASPTWVVQFKKEFNISQRKVTKYIKSTESRSLEQLKESAENFQAECRSIEGISSDLIINTDQMGCEYRAPIGRTLEHKGQKIVDVYVGDVNKTTHSYTAQYSITAAGKLLPTVFICLQEPSGKFGPTVQKRVDDLTKIHKNVIITCSKSGKLTSALVDVYITTVIQPYVKNERFVLILDSWSGQKKPQLYERFKNDDGETTCVLKFIPPGCTSYCQPLDTYIHRQIKLFIKRFQNCTYLLERNRQIYSREDVIKLQSIVHQQLSSPKFRNMIEYSWFSARLINDRDVFLNVKEICFPETRTAVCINCQKVYLIRCSWCEAFYCFPCFYDEYHPATCDKYFTNV